MNFSQIIVLTLLLLLMGCTQVQVAEQEQVTEQVQGTGQEQATDLEQVADRKEPVNDPEIEEIDEEDVDRLADATKVFLLPFFMVQGSINVMNGEKFFMPMSRLFARSRHQGGKAGEIGCAILDAIDPNHCDISWKLYLKSLEKEKCPDGEEDCPNVKKECLEGEEDCWDGD